jgi:hypothetical protein
MWRVFFVATFVGLATIVGSADAAEQVEPRRAIVLRVTNAVEVPLSITYDALEHARQILKKIGVSMVWNSVSCLESAPAPLVVDLKVPGHAAGMPSAVLGSAVGSANPLALPPTMSVFYGDVQDIAQRHSVSAQSLFGFVIAHELGHLLLGPDSPTSWGLMRPVWTRQGIFSGVAQGQFHFTVEEAGRIRRQLR